MLGKKISGKSAAQVRADRLEEIRSHGKLAKEFSTTGVLEHSLFGYMSEVPIDGYIYEIQDLNMSRADIEAAFRAGFEGR